MVKISEMFAYEPDQCDYHELYRVTGDRWADLEAAARVYDDACKDTFDLLVIEQINSAGPKKMALNRAEIMARQHPRYKAARDAAIRAKRRASKEKILMNYYSNMIHKWQALNKMRMLEIQMGGFST